MRHRLHPAVATVVVVALCQAACVSWTQIEPADVGDYDEVRITRPTGDKESLWDPHTAGDTLVGIQASGDTLRMSLSRVQEIRVGTGQTAKIIVGVAAAALTVAAVLVFVENWRVGGPF